MSRTRTLHLLAVAVAVLAFALAARPPDLRPVMPEVDGVHPLRALQALRTAYAPGGGFLDKYPPLGSFLFGLAVAGGDDGSLAAAVDPVLAADPAGRRARLWPLRDALQAALERERLLSRLAMAACAGLVVLLAGRLAGGALQAGPLALAGPLLAGVALAVGPVPRVYAGTTNVDALALLPALGCVLALLHARWMAAGLALAAAVALKDPQVALVPVLLGGAAWRGGRKGLLRVALSSALGYALLSGAATGPQTWLTHVRYLLAGGVEGVDGIDHGDPSAWGRLLLHCGWLLLASAGGYLVLVLALPLRGAARERRDTTLVSLAALAPLAFFVLPVGFVYARFLLPTLALLLALAGAALARPAGVARGAWRVAAAAVLAGALGLLLGAGRQALDATPDARALLVERLQSLAPRGGRVLLFADEREHGPALDPALWELDVAGLAEVAPRLAALREQPAAARPDWIVVLHFPTELPSGAPRPPEPEPRPGERVAGLYEVAEVLRAPRGRLERAVAWRPDITLLRRLP